MANHQQEVLRRLFDLVIAAPADLRASILERECGGDAGLKQRIRAMVAAAEDEQFLAAPTGPQAAPANAESLPTLEKDLAGTVVAAARAEAPGARIGNYKLLQNIGEGGFGSVFMAEQERPVQRKVALKIIKLGMDTRQVIARFEQERQALAMMDHPNIARVLDAGATDTGRPYFVMELCKGDPIVAYCDKNNLNISARLELFAQVCQAVQHAHTKGIIHRDIKPSNVLVSTQDGRPNAKVIDFGIAKATSSKLTEKTLFTEHKQLIGTPEYMSPEQAEGSLDIDTRTDVYSLGVLLYELLTGSTPFDAKSLRSAAFAEIQRIIREVEPPKPSTRLNQNTDTLAGIAARRQSEPRKLGSIVRGELDWIVMKALEKDRQRRYETANGLALDIHRYLTGEPVVAAPPSATYRLRKFVRRNKGSVIAAGAVAAALVLGIIGTSYGLVWAIHERDRATQEAARAKVLNSFMQQMILSANPEDAGDRQVTVADMLLKASEKADKTLQNDPIAEGEARTFLALTLRTLGRIDEAAKEAERAVALRAGGPEQNTLHHAESLRTLGLVQEARGDYQSAVASYEKAMSILKVVQPPPLKELCEATVDLTLPLIQLSRFAEAEKLLDQGDALVNQLRPPSPGIRADYVGRRALLITSRHGDLEKAEALEEQEVALRRQLASPTLLADALNSLALCKLRKGDHAGALLQFQECLDLQRKSYGDIHQMVAVTLENMANVYYSKKEYNDAITRLDEVRTIRTKLFGADSFPVARTRFNMGVVASTMGDNARGLELIDGALPVFRKQLGDNNVEVAQALRNRAACLKGLGRPDEALRDVQAALAIFDAAVAPTERGRMKTVADAVELLCLQGAFDAAESLARKALGQLDATKADQAQWIKQLNEQLAKCRDGGAASQPASRPTSRPAGGG